MILLILSLCVGAVWADDCRDKDVTQGVTDSEGRGCNYYDARPDNCGNFDEYDFHAKELCCSCQGERSNSNDTPPPRATREARSTAPARGVETAPPRTAGCFAFDEPEMDKANCDYKNKDNCPNAVPGGGERCRFTCREGFVPPGGDSEQLYMTCDENGKWHAQAACVSQRDSSVIDARRPAPPRTVGTPPPRAEPTSASRVDSAALGNSAPVSSTTPSTTWPSSITTNMTRVSGNSVCGSTTWKSPTNYIRCATVPGVRNCCCLGGCLHICIDLFVSMLVVSKLCSIMHSPTTLTTKYLDQNPPRVYYHHSRISRSFLAPCVCIGVCSLVGVRLLVFVFSCVVIFLHVLRTHSHLLLTQVFMAEIIGALVGVLLLIIGLVCGFCKA